MASGDVVVHVLKVMPPASNPATPDVRVGGNTTSAENVHVWDFDASTIEYLDFLCWLKGYDGTIGITLTLPFSASSATSGVCRWGAAIRRMDSDAEDIDATHTYSFQDTDATTADTSGEAVYPTIALTDGSQMDSWADGELAIIRVRRNASHANDTMSGDAELWHLVGVET